MQYNQFSGFVNQMKVAVNTIFDAFTKQPDRFFDNLNRLSGKAPFINYLAASL